MTRRKRIILSRAAHLVKGKTFDQADLVGDSREWVTPMAFRLDEDLIGVPLARPWKRLLAILLDLFLGYILLGFGKKSIPALLAFVVLVLARRSARAQQKRLSRWGRWVIGVVCSLLILVLGTVLLNRFLGSRTNRNARSDAGKQALTEVLAALQEQEGNHARGEAAAQARELEDLRRENRLLKQACQQLREQETTGLGGMVQKTAADFGLTLGWFGLYSILSMTVWNGWTPGKRLLGIRVVRLSGKPFALWPAFERFGGYAAGLLTGLLGFFQMFWDPNRQAVQDKIGGTVVVDVRRRRKTNVALIRAMLEANRQRSGAG